MKPSPQLAALFLLAVAGVLSAVGVILASEVGTPAAVAYGMTTLALVLVAAVRAKRRALGQAEPAGHPCACCSGGPYTGVEVI